MIAITHVLRDQLAPRPDIELAVVFGSVARGVPTAASDIDLAVCWRGRAPADRDSLLAGIERMLGRAIDLVELDGAPPQLRFEIARDGIAIVERTPGAWPKFRASAFLDWWDFAPIVRRIHRAAMARLREAVDGSG